jgi:UDP-GlcNAc3NAcA epimerase
MKIVTIVGARPQFIKAAVVSRELINRGIREVIIHTGQHYDPNMSDVFFQELSIPDPHYHLGIGGGTHGVMTGKQLAAIEGVLLQERPEWVIVYGDTNSTLAGALAAAKLHIPVAHVEAGLRSFNKRMPEEINRILTDHASSLLLTPTPTATQNLANEGISSRLVAEVGDVMFDASLFYRNSARAPRSLDNQSENFLLATVHRAENTDDPVRLRAIFEGLSLLGGPILVPLHPRTRSKIQEFKITKPSNVRFLDPVSYLEMLWLEEHCIGVLTDSGGVQKEAYFLGKPCITLRDETEWVELVDLGSNRLVGADAKQIFTAVQNMASLETHDSSLFGGGRAGPAIVENIMSYLALEIS